ncbi:two pore channel protein 1-like [Oppia nitens]|uniref:two pore channel protein 1-like n=1 Tax=Oppia nitens TaxID=1686743 RepID=UPI0023DB3BD8|nr:two pore channel protein 1-like [Oppia nitens]
MLFLLFFFMLVFAILGFYMFSPNPSDPYFSTIGQSFVSLFVLLTTANFPDVMMPSYKMNRISSVFFIAFLIIHVYFLMNIMLAVVYEAFNRIEKEKFRKLLLHRRRACKLAFNLLVTQKLPQKISYKHLLYLLQTFVTLYGLEACLKLIGFGLIRYFSSGWNRFDFAITCLAIIGLIFTESMRLPFSFVFVLRSIRFLHLYCDEIVDWIFFFETQRTYI